MKTALVLLLSFAAIGVAADQKQQPVKEPGIGQNADDVKRLGSVTWDPQAHKLKWVVQKGSMVAGEFVPKSEQRFEVSPDEAVMATADERRGFEEEEGVTLHRLLDVLSLYCAESVVWWDQGQGTPLAPRPSQPKPADEKPVRVKEQQKPSYRVPEGNIVAALTWAQ